jgi:drug/metabolite transporter (DMT)-like permease
LRKDTSYNSGLAYVFLATIGWSLSGLFVRLMPGLDGWQINCWRGLWLAASLVVYLVIVHGRHTIDQFDAIPFAGLVISALCFAVGTTFYVSSLTYASTANVSVIGATSPLITALLSPWVTGERPHIVAWFSAILALVGAAVIAQHGLEVGHWFGLLLSSAVPFTFALQTLLLRKYRDFDMMAAICIGGFLSFIIAGFASLTIGHASAFNIGQHDFLLLVLMGLVQLGLPLIFYGWGARAVPAITLSLIAVLDAVFNPFWSWAFAGEKPEIASLIGGAIILGAVVLSIGGGHFFKHVRDV